MPLVPITRSDGTQGEIDTPDDVSAPACDANGAYAGILPLPLPEGHQVCTPPPEPVAAFRWVAGAWMRPQSLADLKVQAKRAVDAMAGQTRVKYVTSVPGQEATYLVKYEQAKEWLANPRPQAPAYVAAEAAAMGVTIEVAAQSIVGTADYWNNVVGPLIEQTRRTGSIAIEAAQTSEQVQSALNSALGALAAI